MCLYITSNTSTYDMNSIIITDSAMIVILLFVVLCVVNDNISDILTLLLLLLPDSDSVVVKLNVYGCISLEFDVCGIIVFGNAMNYMLSIHY